MNISEMPYLYEILKGFFYNQMALIYVFLVDFTICKFFLLFINIYHIEVFVLNFEHYLIPIFFKDIPFKLLETLNGHSEYIWND